MYKNRTKRNILVSPLYSGHFKTPSQPHSNTLATTFGSTFCIHAIVPSIVVFYGTFNLCYLFIFNNIHVSLSHMCVLCFYEWAASHTHTQTVMSLPQCERTPREKTFKPADDPHAPSMCLWSLSLSLSVSDVFKCSLILAF